MSPKEKRPEVASWPVSGILSDPIRFQSRAEYPRDVLDTDLSDVEVFNPMFAELLRVWRDPTSGEIYVIDGHRRLELAQRTRTESVDVIFLDVKTDAEAFALGVILNIVQWRFREKDLVTWAAASRRAAVERSLHTGWLDPRSEAAKEMFEFYPDLERRYGVDSGA